MLRVQSWGNFHTGHVVDWCIGQDVRTPCFQFIEHVERAVPLRIDGGNRICAHGGRRQCPCMCWFVPLRPWVKRRTRGMFPPHCRCSALLLHITHVCFFSVLCGGSIIRTVWSFRSSLFASRFHGTSRRHVVVGLRRCFRLAVSVFKFSCPTAATTTTTTTGEILFRFVRCPPKRRKRTFRNSAARAACRRIRFSLCSCRLTLPA